MRVPPEVLLAPKKWHLAAVTLLLAASIIAVGVFSGLDTGAVVTQSNRITKAQVAVARVKISTGEVFENANVSLEVRPVELVPDGALKNLSDVIGKRAGTEIPPGMPIADWLLGSPDELLPDAPAAAVAETASEDMRLQDIPLKVLDAEEAKKELLGH